MQFLTTPHCEYVKTIEKCFKGTSNLKSQTCCLSFSIWTWMDLE